MTFEDAVVKIATTPPTWQDVANNFVISIWFLGMFTAWLFRPKQLRRLYEAKYV